MDEKNWMMLLSEERQIGQVMKTNQYTEQFGLQLSEQEAMVLVRERIEVLQEQQRVEFCQGILEKLIFAFCDSAYIQQNDYAETIGRLQMKCNYSMEELIPVVAKLAEKYTSGESTSITYEKAQQLMEAVLYCMEEYQNQAKENLMPHRQDMTASEAYETGYGLVVEKAMMTAEKYNKLIGTFRDFGNENYRDTVTRAIPGFLQYYDARFAPQNTIITMDYPTIRPVVGKCGVDAVYEYVERLSLEQKFMEKFPDDFVIRALSSYHSGYRKQLFNVCGILLRFVILQPAESNRAIHKNIKKLCADRSQDRLRELLNEILHSLICKGYEGDVLLESYLQYETKEFAFDLTMRQREKPV